LLIFPSDFFFRTAAGFGLPGCTHEDDALRSVLSALEIKEALSGQYFWPCSIGITRGKGKIIK
jgi:hypothetical protein